MVGLGLAGSCPAASALPRSMDTSLLSSFQDCLLWETHGGAWVIYRRGKDGKWEHKHMVCIGNGARAAP